MRAALVAAAPVALALLTELFWRLHAARVRYCQWKSNEHLDASLLGETDFDVLVDRKDARRLARVLAEVDFKPFRKLAGREYPGVEDYLGFDTDTGRLSHLHVHYQLTLGEKFLKGHRLPWEDTVLDTRVLDAEHGVYVIDPQLEALLLVTRAALKLRARDYVVAALGYRYVRGDVARELRWLARRVDAQRLGAVARPLVGERATALLSDILASPSPSIRQLVAFRRSVRPRLRSYRMYGPVGALVRRWAREASWLWAAVRNRARGLGKRSTRTAPQGGLAVCVTGPQPAATTVARQLIDWLAPHMAVLPALGAADAPVARRARGRGMVVVADGLPRDRDALRPDLIIPVSDRSAPAMCVLQAQRAIWGSM